MSLRAPVPQLCPNRAAARSSGNRAPVPLPLQGARCQGQGYKLEAHGNRAPSEWVA
jgi:hypothetical protein